MILNNIKDLEKCLKAQIVYDPNNGGGIKCIPVSSSGIQFFNESVLYSDDYINFSQINHDCFGPCIKAQALQADPKTSSFTRSLNVFSRQNFQQKVFKPSNNKSHILITKGLIGVKPIETDSVHYRYGLHQLGMCWEVGFKNGIERWSRFIIITVIFETTIWTAEIYNLQSNNKMLIYSTFGEEGEPKREDFEIGDNYYYKLEKNDSVSNWVNDNLNDLLISGRLSFMGTDKTKNGRDATFLYSQNDIVYFKELKYYFIENDDTFQNTTTTILPSVLKQIGIDTPSFIFVKELL